MEEIRDPELEGVCFELYCPLEGWIEQEFNALTEYDLLWWWAFCDANVPQLQTPGKLQAKFS